jgi:hypothetical protein
VESEPNESSGRLLWGLENTLLIAPKPFGLGKTSLSVMKITAGCLKNHLPLLPYVGTEYPQWVGILLDCSATDIRDSTRNELAKRTLIASFRRSIHVCSVSAQDMDCVVPSLRMDTSRSINRLHIIMRVYAFLRVAPPRVAPWTSALPGSLSPSGRERDHSVCGD